MRVFGAKSRPAVAVEAMERRALLSAYYLSFDEEFSEPSVQLGTSATDTVRPWSTLDRWGQHYIPPSSSGVRQDYQYYTNPLQGEPSQFSVTNGVLSMKAEATPAGVFSDGQEYLSGQLTTAPRSANNPSAGGAGFSQQYGYYEIRAKLPLGQGMWPSFWLKPSVTVPSDQDVELDVFEVLGNAPNKLFQTQHWGGYGASHQQDQYVYRDSVDVASEFHTYGLEWTADTVTWYVDGVKTESQPNRANVPMYMRLSFAIGGWDGNTPNAATPSPAYYDVDYVRVYSSDPTKAISAESGYGVNAATLPVSLAPLDHGFNFTDVGAPGVAGSGNDLSATSFQVKGAGTGLANGSDKFGYVSHFLDGDGWATAKIDSLSGDTTSKAGLMLRAGTAASAPFAAILKGSNNTLSFAWRTTAGGAVSSSSSVTVPAGATDVRVARSGNSVAAAYSTNGGVSWTAIGTPQTVDLGGHVTAGMLAFSGNATTLATANFSNLSVRQAMLERHAWTATTNGTATYFNTANAIDASPNTVWKSGNNLNAASSHFSIDLGAVSTFQHLRIDQGPNTGFYAPGFKVQLSDDGVSWDSPIAVVEGMASTRFVSIPLANVASARHVRLVPTESVAHAWQINEVEVGALVPGVGPVAPASNALPAGWADNDIGSPGIVGWATQAGGTYSVRGSGIDIAGTTERFNYASTAVAGDQTITARVAAIDAANTGAKAGVMFRDSLTATAANVSVFVINGGGVWLSYRAANGGGTVTVKKTGVAAPAWIRLVRTGSTITGYYALASSPNTWVAIGTTPAVAMSSTAYRAGLAVASRSASQIATGTFADVAIAGGGTMFASASAVTPPVSGARGKRDRVASSIF